MREGVAVWPQRNQRIMGRLSLVHQHRVLFLSWMPYSQSPLAPDGSFQAAAATEPPAADRHLYALHPIPLSDVKVSLSSKVLLSSPNVVFAVSFQTWRVRASGAGAVTGLKSDRRNLLCRRSASMPRSGAGSTSCWCSAAALPCRLSTLAMAACGHSSLR